MLFYFNDQILTIVVVAAAVLVKTGSEWASCFACLRHVWKGNDDDDDDDVDDDDQDDDKDDDDGDDP